MPARWIESRPTSVPFYCEGRVKEGPCLTSNIHDGDGALVVLSTGEEREIRLSAIDAPEFRQMYYRESRKQLARWIGRRPLLLEMRGQDYYGRWLTLVSVQDGPRLFSVNQGMVRMGKAWALGPLFREEEAWAKQHRIGLWRDGNAVAPWIWRLQHPKSVPTPWTGGAVPPPQPGHGGG